MAITMSVRDAVSEYRHASKHKSVNTQRNNKQRLLLFAEWCEQQKLTMDSITSRHIRLFLDDVSNRAGQKTEKVRISTIRSYGKTVKAFMAWLANEEEYDVSPKVASRIELPRPDQVVIETFSAEQIHDLFEAVERQPFPERDKALLCVLLDTGCRASEVCDLLLSQVWLDADDSYIKVMGKGRKEREVPLGRQARITLRRYITRYRHPVNKEEPHVFLGHRGDPLTRSGLHQLVQNIGYYARIKGVRCSPHTFRHTFACMYLLNNNGDIYKLSRLMGHTSIRASEQYLHSIKNKQAREGESVLDRLKKDM